MTEPETQSNENDDDWEVCTDCGGCDPYTWFCTTCNGEGGWEPLDYGEVLG